MVEAQYGWEWKDSTSKNLFLDNVSSHSKLTKLKSIQEETLPPNAISKLQSLDQCIAQTRKFHYHKRFSQQMLFPIDFKEHYHINVLAAINDLYNAWGAIKESTIAKCFKHVVKSNTLKQHVTVFNVKMQIFIILQNVWLW